MFGCIFEKLYFNLFIVRSWPNEVLLFLIVAVWPTTSTTTTQHVHYRETTPSSTSNIPNCEMNKVVVNSDDDDDDGNVAEKRTEK